LKPANGSAIVGRIVSAKSVGLPELLEALGNVEPERIPAALSAIAAVQAKLAARLLQNGNSNATQKETRSGDRLLSAKEAGKVIGVSADWLWVHASELPFTRRLPGCVNPKDPTKRKEPPVRFAEEGIQKWIKERGR
jgi:predicted DNA-binding transcriptional regulator AlpA